MVSKDFLTAGNAILTVSNPAGEYYTYRVTAPDDQNELHPIWFVGLLTGPQNTKDYSYLGLLRDGGKVHTTAKSKFQPDTKPVKVAQWAFGLIWEGKEIPAGYKIEHVGRCGRCGRPLTTPASIESGIGPICEGRE